jgi:hypothetical protein
MICKFHDEQGAIHKINFFIDNGKEDKIKDGEMYEINFEKIKRELKRHQNALNFDEFTKNEAERDVGTVDSKANSSSYQ